VQFVAARLRVLADPTRIRLLGLLDRQDATVRELAEQLATTGQDAAKQLCALHQAGIVHRCRSGPAIRYRLADWTAWWLVEQIALDAAAAPTADD
jgi:DNA-binding transcriptional ArsR family regulator